MPLGDLSCIKENMMRVRVILVCALLLLVAVPTFALPLCAHCNEWNECESSPGDNERCSYDANGLCYTSPGRCSVPWNTPVAADWTVASIEISRPSLEAVTITAPSVTSETPAPASRTTSEIQ
jgi:hypothetical protein